MSKRQADYLSSLLGEAAPSPISAPDAPAPHSSPALAGTTLLARESALARVATGEVSQITQLRLDPARVRIWDGNARHQASLNEAACRDLIDAILAEGGQKVPAIVRRVSGDPAHDYEVIAGSRRHWAISWLRANSYPDMLFLAQVHVLDDEAAFRLSDIENRARKDVSDFERAHTYLHALEAHYGGKQVRMAERLRLSKGWLSKMLCVGALPDWAVAAFASPADIQLTVCYPLAQKIQTLRSADPQRFAAIRQASQGLQAEQAALRADSRPPLPAAEVVKRLMNAGEAENEATALLSLPAANGRTALSVLSSNRNGVSVRLHSGSGASDSELTDLFRAALKALDEQGRGVRR
jgi:ParB family chromosome partitioning protein